MPIHEGVICDVCGRANFEGLRYKCEVCYNYDLCSTCYDNGATSYDHSRSHPMTCMSSPAFVVNYHGRPLDYKISEDTIMDHGAVSGYGYYYTIWDNGAVRRHHVVIPRSTFENLSAPSQQRPMTFDQIVKVLRPFMMGRFSTNNEIIEGFNILDRDHSGFIDFTEFANFVSAIRPNVTTNQLVNYIQQVDRNRDLKISMSEFTNLILNGIGKDIIDGRLS